MTFDQVNDCINEIVTAIDNHKYNLSFPEFRFLIISVMQLLLHDYFQREEFDGLPEDTKTLFIDEMAENLKVTLL